MTLANVPTVLPAANLFTVTDTNSNTYAVTNIAPTGTDGEYILTLGTAVSGKGTLTVAYGDSSATKDFDTTTAGTTLSVESSDALTNGLTADGADNTIITVDVLQNGILDTSFNGTVKFISLKGATFAKDEVAFDQGKASVQLTSIASANEIDDTIVATINNANDPDNIGKSIQIPIKYVPADSQGGSGAQVYGTVAIGNTSGDVKLKFNNSFDFSKLYADWVANPNIITDNGNQVDDIKSVDLTTVDLVLNEADALEDNSTVTVVTSTSPNPLTATLLPSTLTYNLVDATAPAAVGLTTPDYRTLVAQFSEPVVDTHGAAIHQAVNPSNWVLNGTQLTAADFVNATGPDAGKDGVVYTPDASKPVDNRAYVTLTLSPAGQALLKTDGSSNLLQAYNIEDYAGLTDTTGQNYATTQEFTFKTPAVPNAPVVQSVIEQSPEQYLVTFNQPLVTALSKADFAVKYETAVLADGTPDWTGSTSITTEDPSDPFVAANATVTPVPGTQNAQYLINLNQDWTVTDNTSGTAVNYYAPKHNMIQITSLHANPTNLAGVKMAADSVNVLTMSLDANSPEIASASQEVLAGVPQQLFDVTMKEPVQIAGLAPNNSTILTPSQTQTAGTGIPTPTFQFVSEDGSSTVDGVLSAPIDATNMKFVVAPQSPLAAGNWTLYIRSISDQVGNTSATTSYALTVQGPAVPSGTPTIIWADAHDNVGAVLADNAAKNDVIDIQFGTAMSTDALKSTMYTVNGNVLPVGTMITSKLVEYDAVNHISGTLVTITLPTNFLGDTTTTTDTTITAPGTSTTPDTFSGALTPNILNVSKSLTDSKGNAISGATQVQMTYGTAQDL